MPLHYNGKSYASFEATVKAVKRANPSWSTDRARRYVGALESVQKTKKKKSTMYKGFEIRPMPAHINQGRGYLVDGIGAFTTVAAAKREINKVLK